MLALLVMVLTCVLAFFYPLSGLLVFLLAYTGFSNLFIDLGVFGRTVGTPLRADNLALVVAILVLLRRPRRFAVDRAVEVPLWIITALLPLVMWFLHTSVYSWMAGLWRIWLWAPLFSALLRLNPREMNILRWGFMVILGLAGWVTIYAFVRGDISLYSKLSAYRVTDPYGFRAYQLPIESLRMTLPGVYSLGHVGFFVAVHLLVQSYKQKRLIAVLIRLMALLGVLGILGSVFFTLSRFSTIAIGSGAALAVMVLLGGGSWRRRSVLIAVLLGLIGLGMMIPTIFPAVWSLWEFRFAHFQDASLATRLANNGRYWGILTSQFSLLGNPSYNDWSRLIGGYHDVVAPMAIWWEYGLIPAALYLWTMGFTGVRLLQSLRRKETRSRSQLPAVATCLGLFVAYNILTGSGWVPHHFDRLFALSYVFAECARATGTLLPSESARQSSSRRRSVSARAAIRGMALKEHAGV
jgi:hypothetical protein